MKVRFTSRRHMREFSAARRAARYSLPRRRSAADSNSRAASARLLSIPATAVGGAARVSLSAADLSGADAAYARGSFSDATRPGAPEHAKGSTAYWRASSMPQPNEHVPQLGADPVVPPGVARGPERRARQPALQDDIKASMAARWRPAPSKPAPDGRLQRRAAVRHQLRRRVPRRLRRRRRRRHAVGHLEGERRDDERRATAGPKQASRSRGSAASPTRCTRRRPGRLRQRPRRQFDRATQVRLVSASRGGRRPGRGTVSFGAVAGERERSGEEGKGQPAFSAGLSFHIHAGVQLHAASRSKPI